MVAASSPDTAASLTLGSPQIFDGADVRPVAEETVATAAGMVKMNAFKATIELPVGRYDATVASLEIPKTSPSKSYLAEIS